MREAYQAYGDYHSMMDLTEAFIEVGPTVVAASQSGRHTCGRHARGRAVSDAEADRPGGP